MTPRDFPLALDTRLFTMVMSEFPFEIERALEVTTPSPFLFCEPNEKALRVNGRLLSCDSNPEVYSKLLRTTPAVRCGFQSPASTLAVPPRCHVRELWQSCRAWCRTRRTRLQTLRPN